MNFTNPGREKELISSNVHLLDLQNISWPYYYTLTDNPPTFNYHKPNRLVPGPNPVKPKFLKRQLVQYTNRIDEDFTYNEREEEVDLTKWNKFS